MDMVALDTDKVLVELDMVGKVGLDMVDRALDRGKFAHKFARYMVDNLSIHFYKVMAGFWLVAILLIKSLDRKILTIIMIACLDYIDNNGPRKELL